MLADIAKPRCPEQSIGNGMGNNIGVAMARKWARARELHSTEN
jgi:hypothetical protein